MKIETKKNYYIKCLKLKKKDHDEEKLHGIIHIQNWIKKNIDHTIIKPCAWRIKWFHRQIDERMEDWIYLSIYIVDSYHGAVRDGSLQNVDKVRVSFIDRNNEKKEKIEWVE